MVHTLNHPYYVIFRILFFLLYSLILIIKFDVEYVVLLFLALIGFTIVIKNAPVATKKQPIPKRLIRRKKILSIILYSFILAVSLLTTEPINKLILFGEIIESVTLLSIFSPKEDL